MENALLKYFDDYIEDSEYRKIKQKYFFLLWIVINITLSILMNTREY